MQYVVREVWMVLTLHLLNYAVLFEFRGIPSDEKPGVCLICSD